MKLILDASSLLNLAHGGVLERVLSIPGTTALIGPQVYNECQSIKAAIDELVAAKVLGMATDDDLPAGLFFDLLERHGLGPGETECIAFATHDATIDLVCCDDRRARNVCSQLLGRNHLTGTIGRLEFAVGASVLTREEAWTAYQRMLAAGAFLPEVTHIGVEAPWGNGGRDWD